MSKEAMKLALEALEYIEHNYMSLPAPAEKAITALREALAEQPAQQEPVAWQPIETAPKKEVKILLRSFSGLIAEGYFLRAAYNGVGGWVWPYIHQNPVHWMPLPPPPIHNIKENT
ncbi:hypothetical protein [Phage DSL-LC05]|nr:hypothetical protein [Phage DSL-LC05]